jgi:hypothetical protein
MIVLEKREYNRNPRIFSLFGVIDLVRYSPADDKLKVIDAGHVVLEHFTYDVDYRISISPPISDFAEEDSMVSHKVTIVADVQRKTFSARTDEEQLRARGEELRIAPDGPSRSRVNAAAAAAGAFIFPADENIKEKVSFEYNLIFGVGGGVSYAECSLPYRELTIEDKYHNRRTFRILTGWLTPLEQGATSIQLQLKNDIPYVFRILR